jgi:AcrR family transcriptional regulator
MARRTSIDRRTEILSEAAKLFQAKGYGGTSMRDLAGKVGMEAASMYNHIRSKDELLEVLCFQVGDGYLSRLNEIRASDLSYVEQLRAIIRTHIRMMIDNGPAVNVANNDWKHLPPSALKRFTDARKRYEKGVAQLLEAGMAAGELRRMDTSVALFTLLSSVRWVELWYKPGRAIAPDALEDTITTLLLNGLTKPTT